MDPFLQVNFPDLIAKRDGYETNPSSNPYCYFNS